MHVIKYLRMLVNKAVSNNFDEKYIENSFKSVHGIGSYCVMHEVIKNICSNDVCNNATCKLH